MLILFDQAELLQSSLSSAPARSSRPSRAFVLQNSEFGGFVVRKFLAWSDSVCLPLPADYK
jgi:hypothetical protein